MAAVMPFMPLISGAFSAISMISQASAQSDSAASAENAQRYNAEQSHNNAVNAMQVANANEDAQRRKNAYFMGEKRAGLLQSGIGTGGSALDLLEASSNNSELDALNIRYEGLLRGRAYESQGNLDLMQANADKQNADTALTNGYLGAGGALLSGAGKYYDNQTTIAQNNANADRVRAQ